jgi:hypothetical protein
VKAEEWMGRGMIFHSETKAPFHRPFIPLPKYTEPCRVKVEESFVRLKPILGFQIID